MKYFEFGQENPELMVMLPGGGVCYRGAIPIAEEMAKVYHVVLVAYDGFNPDEPGTEYKSTQDEAKRLGDYVVEHCGGKIDILYGVSYGTFVLMDAALDHHNDHSGWNAYHGLRRHQKSRIAEYLPLFPDRAFLLADRQGGANTQKDRV